MLVSNDRQLAVWREDGDVNNAPEHLHNFSYATFLLNLCRLFTRIGYAARHFKETHLTIHNRMGDVADIS